LDKPKALSQSHVSNPKGKRPIGWLQSTPIVINKNIHNYSLRPTKTVRLENLGHASSCDKWPCYP
jgi:hypothetical protein